MAPDTEGVHAIANTDLLDRLADVVFVHGLGGAAHSTWCHGAYGSPNGYFWPRELAKSFPQCGFWTVGYAAGITELGNPGMIIQQRSGSLAHQLVLSGVGDRPVIFVMHSMGGLVVKHMLVDQFAANESQRTLAGKVAGLVFCGTPHRGSALATAASVLASFFGGTQEHVREMHGHAGPLDFLHDQFLNWHRVHSVPVESYVENIGLTRKSWWGRIVPLGRVVERDSANCNVGSIYDVDADHIGLVKPHPLQPAVHLMIVGGVTRFLGRVLSSLPEKSGSPVAPPAVRQQSPPPPADSIRTLILRTLREEGVIPRTN